jgi:hypothetical protein
MFEYDGKAYMETPKGIFEVWYNPETERVETGQKANVKGTPITLHELKVRFKKVDTEMTKAEIMEKLDAKGIEYNKRDTKDELFKLLRR